MGGLLYIWQVLILLTLEPVYAHPPLYNSAFHGTDSSYGRPRESASANLTPNTRYSLESARGYDSSSFVFPDDLVLLPPVDNSGIPLCARMTNSTFCENVEDYPYRHISEAVQSLPEDVLYMLLETTDVGIQGRSPPSFKDFSEDPICTPVMKTFKPKVGENNDKKWLYIVNDIKIEQFVTSETCFEEGKSCGYIDGNLPFGYRSQCRQRYAYKRLLAVHPKKKTTFLDSFPFPSCCTCFVKFPPEFRRKPPMTEAVSPGGRLN
ncbi:protein spaetzle 5-like isoform X1 [Limulus polyphemus]|uniref:Protein spaetzle 5-like isoform X1 n=1 Tax=Limulus polyphemus TaxID=6850 RepID=A0ABM1BCP3_LIMPO|nr:protein spaetzle 5-like isoform X1 [Limulus polyphemus]